MRQSNCFKPMIVKTFEFRKDSIINLPSRPRSFTNGQGKTARNNHICFSQRVKDNTPLLNKGIAIAQNNEQLYCIYNGYRTNLRQRVTEHLGIVNRGTACLSIRDSYHYQDSLLNFKWQMEFVEVNITRPNLIVLELAWRSVHGWPMLCSQ